IKINGDTYYQSIVRDITERKTAEQRLHKVNRALHILSDSNQAIIRARDENHLLKIICDIIIDKGGYRMCWMGYIDAKNNRVNPIMSAGYDEGYTDFLDIDLADPVRSKGPTGRAVKSAKPVFTLDMAADPTYLPWREEAMKRGYRSSIALPLIKGGAVFGTLNIYAEAPNAFDEQEVVLLSELADDLSYGIWALRSENARVTAETERDRLWDYSLDMFCIVSFDGKIKELNPAWERNTGWSSGELMQVVWIDLIHPDDRSAAREKLQRLTENESLDGFEFRLHCKNGAYRWLSVNASPLIDEKLIFAVVRDVTENKIDKENLIAKVTIENILARMSKRFITLEDLDKSIDAGLAEIGCFCKAGRAYLFQFTPDGLMMNNTHEWCAPDVSPEIENLQNLPCSMFPWWMERLEAGEVINVENVADMPPEAEAEKAILEAQSIKSVLVFPLLLENKLAGFVGFDAVTAMRSWRDDELVLLCMLSDILGTAIERRRIEDKLHESEIKFKYVFEASNVGMSLTLPTGEVQANRAYAEMLGYTQDELTGRKWQEITPPDEIATIEKIIEPLLTGERNAVRFNKRYIHKDGHYVWTDVSATMRRDTQGKPLHFIVTIVNISEKKRAEDELRESEERFRSLYENATIGLYRTTPDGKVILANPAFLKMVGYNDFDEIARRAVENRGYVNAADADKFVKLMEMYGEVNDFDTAWQRKDGSTVYVRESARLARDKDGNPLYYEGTVEDITTRKMLEEQFRQAQKMEVVGRLAGGVAHDFNNLLTIITSQTELAQMSLSPDDPIYKELEEILKAAMRAAALTRQLLIFSRRETVAPQVLNINGIIANISKMLKRLLGETIELLPMLAGELWRIKADPGLMEQVVVNLSVNARDAMPQGGKLTIETDNVVLDEAFCSRFPDVKSGEYVLLSISDTGVGMSAEVREKMFEPFFTTKAVGQGTGLGLATVYGIIKQMGGFFDVASELGKGTTIKIYIPRLPAEESIETARIIESDVMPRGTEMILVVEDEDQVREMMAAVLKRLGYKVITAANGGEAWLLSWKMEYEPDLLLTDVIMPHMNGPELAGMIKTLMPKLKVLYTSGYTADVLNKQEMLNIGWNFIQKPFRPAVLAQKVREVLDG
ncbi:MAG: PAS domain S-box protein, partial [Calditrichaeota bacterium]|nr:PAS domain S-box protein [Calditrichota bacterium]